MHRDKPDTQLHGKEQKKEEKKGRRDLLEPLRLGIDSHQKEVGVHDSMHGVVHGDEVDARMPRGVGGPGKAKDGHMVVPKGRREGGREENMDERAAFGRCKETFSLLLLCWWLFVSLPPFLLPNLPVQENRRPSFQADKHGVQKLNDLRKRKQ